MKLCEFNDHIVLDQTSFLQLYIDFRKFCNAIPNFVGRYDDHRVLVNFLIKLSNKLKIPPLDGCLENKFDSLFEGLVELGVTSLDQLENVSLEELQQFVQSLLCSRSGINSLPKLPTISTK